MDDYAFGDIVIARIPRVQGDRWETRHAMVVAADVSHQDGNIILLPLTTSNRGLSPSKIAITNTVPRYSFIKFRPHTVHPRNVFRKCGHADGNVVSAVRAQLATFMEGRFPR